MNDRVPQEVSKEHLKILSGSSPDSGINLHTWSVMYSNDSSNNIDWCKFMGGWCSSTCRSLLLMAYGFTYIQWLEKLKGI